MNYKYIFSDIDGTFLNSEHKILSGTKNAVKELTNKGLYFILVSARMPSAMYNLTQDWLPSMPIIAYGGSLIINEHKKIIYDKKINKDISYQIIKDIKGQYKDWVINFYHNDNWYVEDDTLAEVKNEESIVDVKAKQQDFSNLLKANILPNKLLCINKSGITKQEQLILQQKYPDLKIVRSSDILLEIMDKDISKAKAVDIFLNYYQGQIKETIAFGDNYNDLDMLQSVGLGIAMGNAPQEIKSMVNKITLSNDDDGIYMALKDLNLVK